MISTEELNRITGRYQTSILNIKREYAQHLFLSSFYRQEGTKKVYFKGGTALRMVFKNPRFSQDLDFSTPLVDLTETETNIIDTLEEIEKTGINTEIVDSKMTTGGYLGKILFDFKDGPILVKFEISGRDKTATGELTTVVSDYLPPYSISVLKKEIIVKEKVQALLTRGKPRDFYDLYFLIRASLLGNQEKTLLKEMAETVHKTEIPFKRELESFLPKGHWQVIKDFKENLERELLRA